MRPCKCSQTFPRKGWPRTFFPASLFAAGALIAALLVLTSTPAPAVVRITNDPGGNIGAYYSRYQALRSSNEEVIIDGRCSSACTMVLGIVPADRICVTRHARLGFHAAWQPNLVGRRVINGPGTRTLMSFYPSPIRHWIERNGGLGSRMMYLSGRELMAIYRECR
jgi:hypothetical protein